MKAKALFSSVAGATCLLALTVSDSIASGGEFHPIKTGLWEIESHSNWAMFVVSHDWQPAEKRARISAQALERPFYKRACVTDTGAKHPDTIVFKPVDCDLKSRTVDDGVTKADGTCRGRKDGITELHIVVTSTSPETAFIDIKGTLDPAAGYPVIETYKMRWSSADCGDLLPGAIHPMRPPQ